MLSAKRLGLRQPFGAFACGQIKKNRDEVRAKSLDSQLNLSAQNGSRP